MDKDKNRLLIMRLLLYHNVPRFIAHIKNRGGVSEDEWAWLTCEESAEYSRDDISKPAVLLARADEYLLYPKDLNTFNKGLFVLVLALAIMSFVPRGVEFFGLRFCSQIEGFVEVNEWLVEVEVEVKDELLR